MRQPGVEPGAKAWEASMLPIHHWRVQHAIPKASGLKKHRERNAGGTCPHTHQTKASGPENGGHQERKAKDELNLEEQGFDPCAC
jgi:hypothetical protein